MCSIYLCFLYNSLSKLKTNKNVYVRSIVGPFDFDLVFISKLIVDKNICLAFTRFGDGEYSILHGLEVNAAQDNWKIEGKKTILSSDLHRSLRGHFGENYFYGFPSIDSLQSLNFYINATDQNLNFITYANLFVNSNYPRTKLLLEIIMNGDAGDVVIIANSESKKNSFLKFKSIKYFLECPKNAPARYNNLRPSLFNNWKTIAKQFSKTLFIFSCGPLSKIAIMEMWAVNELNRYIDFGSSVDEILQDRLTRSYMKRNESLSLRPDPSWKIVNGQVVFIKSFLV